MGNFNPSVLAPELQSYAILPLLTEEMVKNILLPCAGSYLMSCSFIQQIIAEHLMCGTNYANTEETEDQG